MMMDKHFVSSLLKNLWYVSIIVYAISYGLFILEYSYLKMTNI